MPGGESILAVARSLGEARSTYLVLGLLSLAMAAYLRLRRSYEFVRRTQQEWRGTVDAIADLILTHDDEGRLLQVNRGLSERLGADTTQLVGQRVVDVLPRAKDNQSGACPYCKSFSNGSSEGEDPCFGGWATVSSSRLPASPDARRGTVHVVRDITDQIAAEERYTQLFHGLREAVFVTAPEGTIIECNPALVTMLGYDSRQELMKANARDLYADHRQRAVVERAMQEEGYVHNHELMLKKKDGALIVALETSFASRDHGGKVMRYQGFLLDITQSKRAQEEVRRKNRELDALNTLAGLTNRSLDLDEVLTAALQNVIELFAADSGSAYVFDRERKVFMCRASSGHETTAGMLVPMPASDEWLRHARETKLEVTTFNELAESRSVADSPGSESIAATLGVLLWSRDEINGWVGVSWRTPRPIAQADRELMAAIGRQIATSLENARLYQQACQALDNLQRALEQLLQSEKMSAVGQLISGVAHELNNPLTAILGYTQLLENEPLSDRCRDFLQKIFRQAQRTHRVVENLLSFARQRQPRKEQVDLRRVLDDTLTLRDYDLRLNNIVVQRIFQPDLPVVIADQHQLEQVFLNIINNAVDAIMEAGKGGNLQVSCFAQNGSVCAEFHDSGRGLPDAKRIFDPFYTTKQVGKGTGLGLSICYGIVKEHGGDVRAWNHNDGGAVFQVSLPAVAGKHRVQGSNGHIQHGAADSVLNCRILLVDDEDSVLEFEREALAGAGAEVVALRDGQQAIEQLQRHSFDVLIFDGKMPGSFNGIELCHWLSSHRSDLLRRVVLTVSNAGDPALTECLRAYEVHCLSKPFEVAALFAICRAVLERRPPALIPA